MNPDTDMLATPACSVVVLTCGVWVEPTGLAKKLDIKAGALIPSTNDFLMSGSEKKNTIPRPSTANRTTPRKYQGEMTSTKCSFGGIVVNVLPRVIRNGLIPPAAPASNAFIINRGGTKKLSPPGNGRNTPNDVQRAARIANSRFPTERGKSSPRTL